MTSMMKRPGGKPAKRALHFIWLVDCSGSMAEKGKIQSLNTAIKEAIPHMRASAKSNDKAEILVRAIRFADGAQWHITQPTPVDSFKWEDVAAEGVTDMGRALRMVAEELNKLSSTERGLKPVLVLITDGHPTDDFSGGLRALNATPWGQKAVRMAVAIGEDAAKPEAQDVLQRFIGNTEKRPLRANNPEALVQQIIYTSTTAIQESSRPGSPSGSPDDEDQNTPGGANDDGPQVW